MGERCTAELTIANSLLLRAFTKMSETDTQSCPECGAAIVPGKVYCHKCGFNLSRAAEEQAAPQVATTVVEPTPEELSQSPQSRHSASPITLILACILTVAASYGTFQLGKSVLLYEYSDTRDLYDQTEEARSKLADSEQKRDAMITAIFGGDEKFNSLLESKSITPFSITEYANLSAIRTQFGKQIQAPAIEVDDSMAEDGPPGGFEEGQAGGAQPQAAPIERSSRLSAVLRMDDLPEDVDRTAVEQISMEEAVNIAAAESNAFDAEGIHFNLMSRLPRSVQLESNLKAGRRQANMNGNFRMFGGNWIHHACWVMVSCVAGIFAGTIAWSLGGSKSKSEE